MENACTLLCPKTGHQAIADAIAAQSIVYYITSGSRDAWSVIEVQSPQGLLTLTSMVGQQPGDKLSKLVLSMHNHVRRNADDSQKSKANVLAFISEVEMMVGIVADPAFSLDDERFNCIYSVSEAVDAMIFTGKSILDARGKKLLDC